MIIWPLKPKLASLACCQVDSEKIKSRRRMNLNPFSALRNEFRRKRRAWRRLGTPHALVLMYHRVAPTHRDPLGVAVSPERFRKHLEILSRVAEIVPLARLDDDLRKVRHHRPYVA